jgi:iron complex outermembrane recepter protein
MLAAGAAVPVTVWSEDTKANRDLLETVVVTATRRAEPITTVPFNISAIAGKEIERRGVTNLADIARAVPGLFLVDQGPRAANLLVVRGINSTTLNASELLGNKAGGTVSTYLGDVPIYVDLKPFDLERVEVLLGPQGTLYGVDTLAGAIRYLPNRPNLNETTLSLGSDVYGLAQSQGLGTRTGAVLNVPLIGQKLGLRVGFQYTDDPGFIDYDFIVRNPGVSDPQPDRSDADAMSTQLRRKSDADSENTRAGRVGLAWSASDALQLDLTYYYQDQEVGARTVNNREAFDTGKYVSAARFTEPNRVENELTALEANADLGFATLTSATGYGRFDAEGQRDQTDLLLQIDPAYADFPAFAAFTREDSEEDTFSQELRLASKNTGRWSWLGGVFHQEIDTKQTSLEFTPGYPAFRGIDRPDALEFFSVADRARKENAIFGEIGYRLTDRWQVIAGGRWFEMEQRLTLGTDSPFFSGNPTAVMPSFRTARTDDSDFLKKLSTSYRLSPSTLGYFTVSEGYRAGGVNVVKPCPEPLPVDQPAVCALPSETGIEPDRTTNYELGLRSRMLDGRVQLSAALYTIDWQDIQVNGRTKNGALRITVNGSEARSRGLDLQTSVSIAKHWLIDAQYSFTDAELTRKAPGIVGEANSDPSSPTYDGARAGDRLPGSARHAGNVTASYLRDLPNGWDLRADYGIRATSNVLTSAGERNFGESLAGYALHHAAVGVSNERWATRLYAENLFNRFAEISVRDASSSVQTAGSSDVIIRRYFKGVARPRTVGVNVSYGFGR